VLNGGVTVIDQNATLTTSWQRFSYSAVVGSSAVTLGTIFSYDPTGTAGAADNFEITGVQVEQNYQPTPFEQRPIGTELALCQRYFVKTFSQGVTPASSLAGDGALWQPRHSTAGTNRYFVNWQFPVEMRSALLTVTTYTPFAAGSGWYDEAGATITAATGGFGTRGLHIANSASSAAGRFAVIHATASAEL
jgi:hypothetical protein